MTSKVIRTLMSQLNDFGIGIRLNKFKDTRKTHFIYSCKSCSSQLVLFRTLSKNGTALCEDCFNNPVKK